MVIKVLRSKLRRMLYPFQAWNAGVAGYGIRNISQPLELTKNPMVVFAPHQDDESLGCGGLMAQKQAIGAEVQVIFMTDGAFDPDPSRRGTIAATRKQEALQALDALGIAAHQVTFLNYPDGDLQSLSDSQQTQLLSQLVEQLNAFPQADIFVPHHQDRHPDHEATYHFVRQALAQAQQHMQSLGISVSAQLWQYPVWVFWKKSWVSLLAPRLLTRRGSSKQGSSKQGWFYSPIPAPFLDRKQRAIGCHASQITALPPGFLNRFQLPYELFWK